MQALFSLYVIRYYDTADEGYGIILGLTILFLVGLKDDLMMLAAETKLLAQIVAVLFVLINPELYIFNFHGIPDIHYISVFVSVFVGGFIMIFIINAFQLFENMVNVNRLTF